MNFKHLKDKRLRSHSIHFDLISENHIENELRHEKILIETSKLSSSWANLHLSANDKHDSSDYCISSPQSSCNSPQFRPDSFSGPLIISVTCSGSNNNVTLQHKNLKQPRSSSCRPSPLASPISSRIQCYSPGLNLYSQNKKRLLDLNSISPLDKTRSRKRAYPGFVNLDSDSNSKGFEERFPDINCFKSRRMSDSVSFNTNIRSPFVWPLCDPSFSSSSSISTSPCSNLSSTSKSNISRVSNSPINKKIPSSNIFTFGALTNCPIINIPESPARMSADIKQSLDIVENVISGTHSPNPHWSFTDSEL